MSSKMVDIKAISLHSLNRLHLEGHL